MGSVSDAEKHLKEAKKALSVHFFKFKFKPDYEIAAMEYQEAAKIFQSCGKHLNSVEAFKECADLKQNLGDHFGAGRSNEAAASLHENFLKDWEKCVEFLEIAATNYLNAMKFEASARVYQKIIRIIDDHIQDTDGVITAYEKIFEVYKSDVDDDHAHTRVDVCKSYVEFLARYDRRNELLKVLDRQMMLHRRLEQNQSMPKVVLSKIIVRLSLDDSAGAEQDLEEAVEIDSSLYGSTDCAVAKEAIEAFKCGNADKFKELMNSGSCTYLPVEIAKIAKKLKIESRLQSDCVEDDMDAAEMLM